MSSPVDTTADGDAWLAVIDDLIDEEIDREESIELTAEELQVDVPLRFGLGVRLADRDTNLAAVHGHVAHVVLGRVEGGPDLRLDIRHTPAYFPTGKKAPEPARIPPASTTPNGGKRRIRPSPP